MMGWLDPWYQYASTQYRDTSLVVGLLSLSANLIETVSATRGRSQPGLKHCLVDSSGGLCPNSDNLLLKWHRIKQLMGCNPAGEGHSQLVKLCSSAKCGSDPTTHDARFCQGDGTTRPLS